jgi:hypothetical protein
MSPFGIVTMSSAIDLVSFVSDGHAGSSGIATQQLEAGGA